MDILFNLNLLIIIMINKVNNNISTSKQWPEVEFLPKPYMEESNKIKIKTKNK